MTSPIPDLDAPRQQRLTLLLRLILLVLTYEIGLLNNLAPIPLAGVIGLTYMTARLMTVHKLASIDGFTEIWL